jgi:hypothetical protein
MTGVFWPTVYNLENHLERVQRGCKLDRQQSDKTKQDETSTAKEIV